MKISDTESSGTTTSSEIEQKTALAKVQSDIVENERQIQNLKAYSNGLNQLYETGTSVISGSSTITATTSLEVVNGTMAGKIQKSLKGGPLSRSLKMSTDALNQGTALGEPFNLQSVATLPDQRLGPAFNDGCVQILVDRVVQLNGDTVPAIDRLNARLQQTRYRAEQCRVELRELENKEVAIEELEEELQEHIAGASGKEPNPELQKGSPSIVNDTNEKEQEKVTEQQAIVQNTTTLQEQAVQGASTNPAQAQFVAPLNDSKVVAKYLTLSTNRGKFLRETFTSLGGHKLPDLGSMLINRNGKGGMDDAYLTYIGQVMLVGELLPITQFVPGYIATTKDAAASQALFYRLPSKPRGVSNLYLAPDFLELLISTFTQVRNFQKTVDGKTFKPFARIMLEVTEAFPPTIRHSGSPIYPNEQALENGVFQFTGGHANGYALDCAVQSFDFQGNLMVGDSWTNSTANLVPRAYRSNWDSFFDEFLATITQASGGKLWFKDEYRSPSSRSTGAHLHLEILEPNRNHNRGIYSQVLNVVAYKAARAEKQRVALLERKRRKAAKVVKLAALSSKTSKVAS